MGWFVFFVWPFLFCIDLWLPLVYSLLYFECAFLVSNKVFLFAYQEKKKSEEYLKRKHHI